MAAGASPVAEGFRYASDTNTDWLDEVRLAQLINEGT
jgi:UDP-N-acetylglucosamine 4,6-dehydratase